MAKKQTGGMPTMDQMYVPEEKYDQMYVPEEKYDQMYVPEEKYDQMYVPEKAKTKPTEEFNLYKTVKKAADKEEGMKKGGKVKSPTMTFQTYTKTGKPAGMKTVSVSSASKRADGCAIKGKTKGKYL